MIAYLDFSASVKRYVAEGGSAEVGALVNQAEVVGTAIVSRVALAAALAKAVRMRLLSRDKAVYILEVFNSEWDSPCPTPNDGGPHVPRRVPCLESWFTRLRRGSSGIRSLLAGNAGAVPYGCEL